MTRLTTLNLPGNFHRSFIGFDRLFDEMDRVFENSPTNGSGGYPPYNIAKLNDDEFMISLAVAGFGMDALTIEKDKDVLKIEGKAPKGDEEVNYLHRGIAGRSIGIYHIREEGGTSARIRLPRWSHGCCEG